MRYQLVADEGLPDFLDLPWTTHSSSGALRTWSTSSVGSAALRGKLEPAELYHQLLEHRRFRSEELGRCASMEEAIASYVPGILVTDERVLPADDAEPA